MGALSSKNGGTLAGLDIVGANAATDELGETEGVLEERESGRGAWRGYGWGGGGGGGFTLEPGAGSVVTRIKWSSGGGGSGGGSGGAINIGRRRSMEARGGR